MHSVHRFRGGAGGRYAESQFLFPGDLVIEAGEVNSTVHMLVSGWVGVPRGYGKPKVCASKAVSRANGDFL